MLPRTKKQLNIFGKTATLLMIIFVVVFLFFAFSAQAQVIQDNGGNNNGDTFGVRQVNQGIALSGTDIRIVVAKIIRAVLGLLGIITLGLVLYAGFTIMTAAGSEEKEMQGRKILTNAVIGLIIILSAFSIVSFVINSLLKATGMVGEGERTRPPIIQSFAGSGSLGRVVKDHFPFRDQRDVARNTKIAITFFEPINPASVIINSNNSCWDNDFIGPTTTCQVDGKGAILNPYYGDCLTGKGDFDWERDCDHLSTSSIQIYQSDEVDENKNPVGVLSAAALASYEDGAEKSVYSIVLKPFSLLGSESGNIWNTVSLGRGIEKKLIKGENPVSVFEGQFHDFYRWQFQTNTKVDLTPPYITGVFPGVGGQEKRNAVVQVYFSEAVDPTVAQGRLGPNSLFYNLIFATSTISGEWKLSSGYRVAEFVSDEPCGGQNSCGDNIYCLPVSCSQGGCVDDSYGILARTARLIGANPDSFEAEVFSGIYDMTGNALDGSHDSLAQGQPKYPDQFVTEADKNADNYFWNFSIKNSIERVPPYIEAVRPGIDAERVEGEANLEIDFSRLIFNRYLADNIILEEYPAGRVDDNLGFAVYGTRVPESDKTRVEIKHRQFGPNDLDLYYFPQVSSTLKDVYQQCFYPGWGPDSGSLQSGSNICQVYFDEITGLKIGDNGNCVLVTTAPEEDTGCVQTADQNRKLSGAVADCVSQVMKDNSISPVSAP